LTDENHERELRRFFHERIVPAASALRERGIEFFALAPDRARPSYWTARPREEEYVFQISDNLAAELRELWRAHPELEAFSDQFAAMARELAERREESAQVSSFIYAMF
jgi:hypothetical protein